MFAATLSILTPVSLVGCGGAATRNWTEDVALDNGSIIVIEREMQFTESNSLSGDTYSSDILKSQVAFRGNLSALPAWDVPLLPLLIYRDLDTNEWVIVAGTNSCDVWADRGSPPHGYWEFRLRANKWVQVPISQHSDNRRTNLLVVFEPALSTRHITIAEKMRIASAASVDARYLKVRTNSHVPCAKRD